MEIISLYAKPHNLPISGELTSPDKKPNSKFVTEKKCTIFVQHVISSWPLDRNNENSEWMLQLSCGKVLEIKLNYPEYLKSIEETNKIYINPKIQILIESTFILLEDITCIWGDYSEEYSSDITWFRLSSGAENGKLDNYSNTIERIIYESNKPL